MNRSVVTALAAVGLVASTATVTAAAVHSTGLAQRPSAAALNSAPAPQAPHVCVRVNTRDVRWPLNDGSCAAGYWSAALPKTNSCPAPFVLGTVRVGQAVILACALTIPTPTLTSPPTTPPPSMSSSMSVPT